LRLSARYCIFLSRHHNTQVFKFNPKTPHSYLAFVGIIAAAIYPNYLLPALSPMYFLLPWIHAGSYIGCLFSLAMIIDCQGHPSANFRRNKILIDLLTFLLCASDYFFIVWFVIPVLITLWHQQRINDISKKIFTELFLVISGSGVSGYLIHKVTNSSHTKIKLENILLSLKTFADVLFQHTGVLVFVALWITVSILGFSICARTSIPQEGKEKLDYSHRVFWLWNLYSLMVTFLLVNLYGLFSDIANFRYFQPLLYNPIIVVAWLTIKAVEWLKNYFGFTLIRELSKSFFATLLVIAISSCPYLYKFHTPIVRTLF
jgi:hypothetical protein